MNRFNQPSLKNRIFQSTNFSVLFFLVVICLFIYGISVLSGSSVNDDKKILTDAIERDIVHCYAVEGMYPPSLEYMEEKYGLIYDHDKFLVDYEIFGSNIMPNVKIIERKAEDEL